MHVSEVGGDFQFQIFVVRAFLDNDRTARSSSKGNEKTNRSALGCEAWPPGRHASTAEKWDGVDSRKSRQGVHFIASVHCERSPLSEEVLDGVWPQLSAELSVLARPFASYATNTQEREAKYDVNAMLGIFAGLYLQEEACCGGV